MTITLTAGDAIAVPTAGKALALAPVLYSDAERNLVGCVWFEAVARLCALRELDHLDESPEARERASLAIGAAVAAVLVIVAKCTTSCAAPVPDARWQHRGPDASLGDLNAALTRLAENAGRIAAHCRAVILSNDRAVVTAATQNAMLLAASSLNNREHAGDLLTVAAFHKLSLRECFEAFAATRTAKIAKNAKRYGKEAA